MRPLSQGKVKDVYEIDKETLLFEFSDRVSVFDKIIPSLIPRKGESLCRTSAFWFKKLNDAGIKNHFIRLEGPNKMVVKRVSVIRDYSKINSSTKKYLIPLEVICRHYVAGSLFDKVKSGGIAPEKLGFKKGEKVEYGAKLPKPLVEFTTKLEPVDRKLTEGEALKISGLTKKELGELKKLVLKIDNIIAETVAKRGLIHVDGKKEFAMDENRKIMVIDTFGTLDEDRWWEENQCGERRAESGENERRTLTDRAPRSMVDQMRRLSALNQQNQVIPQSAFGPTAPIKECSKEFVRQHYRGTGYFAALEEARAKGAPEPDIPALPENVIKETAELYARMFERITGERF